MTDEEKHVWDGVERRKRKLLVLPNKRGNVEPPEDKNAAVEEAIQSLLEVKGDIGQLFILYESLDGNRLGSVDSGMTGEQVLMMIELFKHWLLHSQYQHSGE